MPAASTVVKDFQPADSSTRGSHDGAVPSGFILKLFQMVNGAPDDMITVSLLSRSHGRAILLFDSRGWTCWQASVVPGSLSSSSWIARVMRGSVAVGVIYECLEVVIALLAVENGT